MPAGHHGEKLYGAAGEPQNTTVLLETIYKLKQEIQKSHAEKQALAEQLNCLILLVKRSWSGDHNASLHLGNIVGVVPPDVNSQGKVGNNSPVPDKTPVVRHWERLAIKLLEQDNLRQQQEIQQRQQLYIEQRQMYMDELLETHQKEMSQIPNRGNSKKSLEEVDQKFMRTFNQRPSALHRPASGTRTSQLRTRSAGPRVKRDGLNRVELTINDIINPSQSPLNQTTNAAFSGLYKLDIEDEKAHYYSKLDYDDPERYKPAGNLFDLDTVFGPDNNVPAVKRPISAFMPKDKTRQRPNSAGIFLTQKHDRPMKYETTRPVSGKPSDKNRRKSLKSASEPVIKLQHSDNSHQEEEPVVKAESQESSQQCNSDSDTETPPIKVNIGNYKKRPQHVDKFCNELKEMENMEEAFKNSTIALQKKLGIGGSGIVY